MTAKAVKRAASPTVKVAMIVVHVVVVVVVVAVVLSVVAIRAVHVLKGRTALKALHGSKVVLDLTAVLDAMAVGLTVVAMETVVAAAAAVAVVQVVGLAETMVLVARAWDVVVIAIAAACSVDHVRFSHRPRWLKVPSRAFWNCILAATGSFVTHVETMQRKIPIRSFPAHS